MKRAHGLDSGSGPVDGDLASWDSFHPNGDATADAMTFAPSPSSSPGPAGAPSDLDAGPSTQLTAFDPASGMASLVGPTTTSNEPVTNSAVNPGGATAAQVLLALNESGLSFNGSNIKVGVISDSFNNK